MAKRKAIKPMTEEQKAKLAQILKHVKEPVHFSSKVWMKELYEKAGKPTGLPSDRKAFGRLGRRLKKMYDEQKSK